MRDTNGETPSNSENKKRKTGSGGSKMILQVEQLKELTGNSVEKKQRKRKAGKAKKKQRHKEKKKLYVTERHVIIRTNIDDTVLTASTSSLGGLMSAFLGLDGLCVSLVLHIALHKGGSGLTLQQPAGIVFVLRI